MGGMAKRGKAPGFLALCALGRRQALWPECSPRERVSLLMCFKLKRNAQRISWRGGMKI